MSYIKKSIDSAINQDYPKDMFDVVVIDDFSTDGTWDIIQGYNIPAIRHDKNICCGVISTKEGMRYPKIMKDDDIAVLLSGDDYLNDYRVLATLDEEYTKDVWMTYGQFVPISGGYPAFCKPIPDTRTYRKTPIWHASHLITFRKWLFDKIKDEDLKYNGDYLHYAMDAAILFPMIEMAGRKHIKFIEKVLYVYNDMNPACVYKILPKENIREAEYVRSKPIYDEL